MNTIKEEKLLQKISTQQVIKNLEDLILYHIENGKITLELKKYIR